MQEASEVHGQEACSGRDTGIQGGAAVTGVALALGRAGEGNNTGPRCSRDKNKTVLCRDPGKDPRVPSKMPEFPADLEYHWVWEVPT